MQVYSQVEQKVYIEKKSWKIKLDFAIEEAGLPWWLSSKEPAFNAGDSSLTPGLGWSPGEGDGDPLQYSWLENPQTEKPGTLQSMVLQESNTT